MQTDDTSAISWSVTFRQEQRNCCPPGKYWIVRKEVVEAFGKYGIEFHTEGEWESITNQKNDKHYELIIVEQTEMYINSLDSKKQEVKDLKKEYKKQVKNICKIECQTEFISEYVNFVSTLLQNI